jgi:alpha-D-ribose 1-methylphosphonate 5-triphosphate synthase subunit PhnI
MSKIKISEINKIIETLFLAGIIKKSNDSQSKDFYDITRDKKIFSQNSLF